MELLEFVVLPVMITGRSIPEPIEGQNLLDLMNIIETLEVIIRLIKTPAGDLMNLLVQEEVPPQDLLVLVAQAPLAGAQELLEAPVEAVDHLVVVEEEYKRL